MKRLLWIFSLLLLFPAIAHAQAVGVFLGTTTDATGNDVPMPDGFPDWEFYVKGLKANPTQIIITANEDRRWQWPKDQPNDLGFWIVLPVPGMTNDANWWISIAGSVPSSGFHAQVTYPDSTVEEFNIPSAIAVQLTTKLQWDQDAASLNEVQQLSARVYIDGGGSAYGIEANKITCTGAEPTFICTTPFPPIPLSTGTHTLQMTMVNTGGYESAKSNTVSFVVAVVPAPRNLRLIP